MLCISYVSDAIMFHCFFDLYVESNDREVWPGNWFASKFTHVTEE